MSYTHEITDWRAAIAKCRWLRIEDDDGLFIGTGQTLQGRPFRAILSFALHDAANISRYATR